MGRQYINSVELSNSCYELELRCRDRGSKGDLGEEIVLVMSWPHAKAFADLLNKNLKVYEIAFGEVHSQPLENTEKALKEIGAEVVAVKPSEGHE